MEKLGQPRQDPARARLYRRYRDILRGQRQVDHRTRPSPMRRQWSLQARYSDDREAAVFICAACSRPRPPPEQTTEPRKASNSRADFWRAARSTREWPTTSIPHTFPALADMALAASARRSRRIAAGSPHRCIMPSHIFTHPAGLWDESLIPDLASAASAERNNARARKLHAKDYLIYALPAGRTRLRVKLAQGSAARPSRRPSVHDWL